MNRLDYNNAVKEYSENVFRYAYKWTKNEADAKDMVQDVFSKLWINRKSVQKTKAKSWLFTCAHNALVNWSKKRKTLLMEDSSFIEPSNMQPNLALRDLIEQSFTQLSEIQKSVVLLRDAEGYSYEEIGGILGLSESQVKVYLFRARKKVKNQLVSLEVLVA